MDYSKYKFSMKDLVTHIMVFVFCILIVSKLFYGNYYFAVFMIPLYLPITKVRKKELRNKRKKELKVQFNDAIVSMADFMNVGLSVENAIIEAHNEMAVLYGNDSYICMEFKELIKQIRINRPIEIAFEDFAKRTEIDDITLFAQIFRIAKRAGGNMNSLVRIISEHINQSIRVEQEIYVALSAKRMEQRIMFFVPVGIVLYVNMTSPEFFSVMYDTIVGKVIMSISLMIYVGAIYVAQQIMEIDM